MAHAAGTHQAQCALQTLADLGEIAVTASRCEAEELAALRQCGRVVEPNVAAPAPVCSLALSEGQMAAQRAELSHRSRLYAWF